MAEVVLFHHVHGLTDGVIAFADRLRRAGHTVHTPDLFDGHTFAELAAGMAYEEETVGWEGMQARAHAAVEGLPAGLVYAGFSMGAVYDTVLVLERPGALGAVLMESCPDPADFGGWPAGVPVQVHGRDADPYFAAEGRANAEAVIALAGAGELFVYPGERHLFADASLPGYDPDQTALLVDRVLGFLAELDRG